MRIVLDTNQLVRALMRPPQLATFVMSEAVSQVLLQQNITVLSMDELIATNE